MNYELALKLKQAGFPQGDCEKSGFIRYSENKSDPEYVYAPTLSELIESCKAEVHLFVAVGGASKAVHYLDDGEKIDCMGSTPEEAVANLWLELNPITH